MCENICLSHRHPLRRRIRFPALRSSARPFTPALAAPLLPSSRPCLCPCSSPPFSTLPHRFCTLPFMPPVLSLQSSRSPPYHLRGSPVDCRTRWFALCPVIQKVSVWLTECLKTHRLTECLKTHRLAECLETHRPTECLETQAVSQIFPGSPTVVGRHFIKSSIFCLKSTTFSMMEIDARERFPRNRQAITTVLMKKVRMVSRHSLYSADTICPPRTVR